MTRRPVTRPPWCGHCDPDTRLVDLDTAATYCLRCHAATQPGGRHDPNRTPTVRAPRAVALELALGADA